MQKCTRSSLKTYTDISQYSNPGAWIILISIQISHLVSKLRNHSLKFKNQIYSDQRYPCYPDSHDSTSHCEFSLLHLASILSPNYILCLHHWVTQVILRDKLIPYHFVYYFRTSFYIYTWVGYIVHVLRVMINLSNVTQQCLTSFKWCSLISNRFLGVGCLSPGVNA